jgi:hypothetical protein
MEIFYSTHIWKFGSGGGRVNEKLYYASNTYIFSFTVCESYSDVGLKYYERDDACINYMR